MKTWIENIAAVIWSHLTAALRNKQKYALSREEIRQVAFSFSQFGEDLAVQRWTRELGLVNGYYVDVGAFHPVHLSNTLLLHRRGWRGINIDLRQSAIALFDQCRPNDFNVSAAISNTIKQVVVQLNGLPTDRLVFDGSLETRGPSAQFIETQTLQSVLDQCPFPLPGIDYLNIDCEGHDIPVLRSLDWNQYKPTIVTIEALNQASVVATRDEMKRLGYQLLEKLHWTLLFISVEALTASHFGETALPDS
jgi:hypothetical protein